MHCGGDSRLCLDNPHHAEGPIPVRESDSGASRNFFAEAMERVFDGEASRPLRWEDMAAVEATLQQARTAADAKRQPTQATAADKRLRAGFECACGGFRP